MFHKVNKFNRFQKIEIINQRRQRIIHYLVIKIKIFDKTEKN